MNSLENHSFDVRVSGISPFDLCADLAQNIPETELKFSLAKPGEGYRDIATPIVDAMIVGGGAVINQIRSLPD